MEIHEFRDGDVLVLAPDGSVAWSDETSAIEAALVTALQTGFRQVVLDCADVGQLSSDAIRILLMTSRKLERTDGRLVLCGMNAKLKKAFSISRFDKDFTVVATREQAVQRVREPLPPKPVKEPRAKAAASPKVPVPPVDIPPSTPDVAEAAPPVAAAPPAVQPAVPAPVAPIVAAPQEPDRREALAAALLDALGVHGPDPAEGTSNRSTRSDLDAIASGLLDALRVGGP